MSTSPTPPKEPSKEPRKVFDLSLLAKADRPLARLALALLVVVLVLYLLDKFSIVLQQFLIAMFIAYLLLPAHRYLVKKRVPSFVAYLLITFFISTIGFILVVEIRARLIELSNDLPGYRTKLIEVVHQKTGADLARLEWQDVLPVGTNGSNGSSSNVGHIRSTVQQVIGFSTHAFIIFIYLLFILAERASFVRRVYRAFSPEQAQTVAEAIERINASIDQYIYVKTFVSILTGLFTGIALWLFGVKYALLWGVVTFVLNYIPYLGALAAMIPPVLLAMVQFDIMQAFWVLLTLSTIQNVIGYGIEPFMTGRHVDLSPLVLIASLAFWGALWGVVGMLLAVPLMVVIKATLEAIPTTRPIAVLISNDRPIKVHADRRAKQPPPKQDSVELTSSAEIEVPVEQSSSVGD